MNSICLLIIASLTLIVSAAPQFGFSDHQIEGNEEDGTDDNQFDGAVEERRSPLTKPFENLYSRRPYGICPVCIRSPCPCKFHDEQSGDDLGNVEDLNEQNQEFNPELSSF
jgi:hypothetical protein